MKQDKIKMAIADDQTLFREGLRMILQTFENMELVIEAADGPELVAAVDEIVPDVILLDYTMPEMDGYETMSVIRKKHPEIKIIILTMHYDESLMAYMMQNGANGYLLKDEEPEKLKLAIESVFRAGVYFPEYVSKAMLEALKSRVKKPKQVAVDPPTVTFSDREKEILALIGKMPRRKIADTVCLSIKTVDFHIRNLKEKTNCSTTPELVRFAIQHDFQDG